MVPPMRVSRPPTDGAVIKAYLEWQRGPEIGCSFARRIARNPAIYQRRVEVVRGSVTATVAAAVDAAITAAAKDPSFSSAAVLMPEITKIDDLARVALALASNTPPWTVAQSLLPATPVGPMIAFHVTRQIPSSTSTTCPSEALMLGDFKEFPNTRKAPITALEIFVGVPSPNDPKSGKPSTKANLAHLQLPYPSPEAFKRAWSSAEKGRAESLGVPLHVPDKDDVRAKAKVSFVIRPVVAKKLGCHP